MSDTPLFDNTPDRLEQAKIAQARSDGRVEGFSDGHRVGVKTVLDSVDITPNLKIENPNTRSTIQAWLGYVSLGVAVVALFFVFFPEAAFGSSIPDRAIQFVNSLVLMISGYYGLSVTRPNIPSK
jgi:hypothetical protein